MKKKRVSKKTKKVWRKHVDIEDVNQFLEDRRLEERLGIPFDERSNNELFTIDATPTPENVFTSKQKKRQEFLSLPKCFSLLVPHSNVPDPITKRNRVRTPEERKHPKLKLKEEIRKSKGILKAKEIQAITTRNLAKQKKISEQVEKGKINKDLWAVENLSDKMLRNDWLKNSTVHHIQANTGQMYKVKHRPIQKKTSILPSIEQPHGGLSYNPSLKDHIELLTLVAEKEKKIIKEEEHLTRVTTKMFAKKCPQDQHNSWMAEMSEGITPSKNELLEESESDNEVYKSVNPPVKNRKKELKQRRKQVEQRKLNALRRQQKEEKKKISDIYKLKFIQDNLLKKEKHLEKLKDKRIKKKTILQTEPKRLGRKKFEDCDIEFSTEKEISGNLRQVKNDGNLLLDRFKSLQKRNILVPTEKQVLKKGKVKRFEKATHKMGWETKGY